LSLKENTEIRLGIRLHVFLAHAGVSSRRAAEKFISEGRVTVNGSAISGPGVKVLPTDVICFDGKPVKIEERLEYLVLHKPPLYICSSHDPQGRPLALELLPPLQSLADTTGRRPRLYNVGRLDYRSSGLIIFTNDGAFAARLGHPSSEIEKEYLVESTVPIQDRMIEEFSRGLLIEGILYRARQIERTGKKSLRVVLVEGKNREIRRVFSHFHLHPEKLVRVRIGPVCLGSLKEGESRPLSREEISSLLGVEHDNSH